ncbi:MAG: dimethyl sulfoxide reductase anchor subunit family protein [Endozoicomonas sp.]
MDQLSLVFFTVLAQSAVGIFIALGLVELLGKPSGRALNQSFISVWIIMAIGALASVTHLGQPLRMFNVLSGAAHSPLSMEIISMMLFGGAGVAFTAMRLFRVAPGLQKPLLVVAMILGGWLIVSIANVYTLETVPTWNSSWTCFQFLMTAAVVGPVGAATLLRAEGNQLGSLQVSADKALATSACMLLTIAVAAYAGYLFWLGQLTLSANPFTMMGYHPQLVIGRVALLMAGILVWAVGAMRGSNKSMAPAAAGFLMVMVAELAGRVFFYDIFLSASAGM